MSDEDIMEIVNPMMDNLMDASTEIDHEKHIRDFSQNMKDIVTKENLEKQCHHYQKELGYFSKRELIAVVKKSSDVRVFWKQWYTKSNDEFLAFVHIMENKGKLEVVNASVS